MARKSNVGGYLKTRELRMALLRCVEEHQPYLVRPKAEGWNVVAAKLHEMYRD